MTYEIIPFLGLRNPVSSGSHFIALVLSILATHLLWRQARGHFRLQLSALCFGLTMIVQYAASALFHALQRPWEELHYFLIIDLSATFLLIAGTYTPPLMVLLRSGWRRNTYVACMWLLAGAGVVVRWLSFTGILSTESSWMIAAIYAGMAWFSPAILLDVVRTIGYRGLQWALYAFAAYAFGLAAEARGTPIILPGVFGSHELFHVCAMLGTFFHFIFIGNHVLPYALKGVREEETTDAAEVAMNPAQA